MNFKSSYVFFLFRRVKKLDRPTIPTLAVQKLPHTYQCTYLHDVLQRDVSVYSSSSRRTPESNPFPIFRTVAPTDACQSAVTARVIVARSYPAQKAHINTRSPFTHCVLYKQYVIVLVAVNVTILHQTRYFTCNRQTTLERISSSRGRRDHPSGGITVRGDQPQ